MQSIVLGASFPYMSSYCFLYQWLYLLKNVTPPMAETAWSFALPLEMSHNPKRTMQNMLRGCAVTVAFLLVHKLWSSIKMCPSSIFFPSAFRHIALTGLFFSLSHTVCTCVRGCGCERENANHAADISHFASWCVGRYSSSRL